ncbi:MAG: DUF177 domain-containing protein [Bacteroidetes bacterium]|nr:DUF177 domain-containing protein [Flavobacteriales bacterium]NOG56385.1 DUF177 domain-containing protein [Bacteroidota bacterium]
MKKKKQKLIIPFISLKEGLHQFDFKINETFFQQFDYSIIQHANLNIDIDFEKKQTMLKLDFKLEGSILTDCDRCGDPLNIDVSGDEKLIVKFGKEKYEDTDEIKIISENDYELDLTEIIYEFAHLLLPSKTIHESENQCNQEVIERLKELSIKEQTESIDPRWEKLSKLK